MAARKKKEVAEVPNEPIYRNKYNHANRIIHNCPQRSTTWLNLRLGKITGSNAHKLTTKVKFEDYYYELLAETLTRKATEHYVTEAMQWGIDQEPYATEWYEENSNNEVSICGFVEIEETIFGCSPDLFSGDNGLGQIKCPNSKNHLYYRDIDIMTSKDDSDKKIAFQIQWELFVTNLEYSDFISFDPRLPAFKGHIQRVERNEIIINMLAERAEEMQSKIETFLFDNGIVPVKYVPAPETPDLTQKDYDLLAYLRA